MAECRICFNSLKESLVSLCKCKGSIKHIHVSCLKQWLKEKYPSELASILKSPVKSKSKIHCELCKSELKLRPHYLHPVQMQQSSYLHQTLFKRRILNFQIMTHHCIIKTFTRAAAVLSRVADWDQNPCSSCGRNQRCVQASTRPRHPPTKIPCPPPASSRTQD